MEEQVITGRKAKLIKVLLGDDGDYSLAKYYLEILREAVILLSSNTSIILDMRAEESGEFLKGKLNDAVTGLSALSIDIDEIISCWD
jgi:hypothetical protein